MNLYRSLGHTWTGTQADARAANNGDKDFEHIDVPTDKAGLLQFLNEMEARLASEDTGTIGEVDLSWADGVTDEDLRVPGGYRGPSGEPTNPPSGGSSVDYKNGDPSFIFNKSRNPEAIFNCTNCGHQNRNQGQ